MLGTCAGGHQRPSWGNLETIHFAQFVLES
jgi:hypothetical protein